MDSKRWRQRWLWSLGLVPLLLSWPRPVAAQTNYCQRVRVLRQIAIALGLPSGELAQLEAYYCRRSQPSRSRPDTTSNCFHLKMLLGLAQTGGSSGNDYRAIAAEQSIACAFPAEDPPFPWRYENGQTVALGSTWYYPSGQTAKFGNRWYYPNGQMASSGAGWQYPNGDRAQSGGRWYTPSGRQALDETEILRWSCQRVAVNHCRYTLEQVAIVDSPLADLFTLNLAWQGRD